MREIYRFNLKTNPQKRNITEISVLTVVILFLFYSVTLTFADEMTVKKDYCKRISAVAKAIMHCRQIGVPMSETIEIIEERVRASGSVLLSADAVKSIIISAYDSPRYWTEENRLTATGEFQKKIYMQCTETLINGDGDIPNHYW